MYYESVGIQEEVFLKDYHFIAAFVPGARTTSSSRCVKLVHRSCPCATSPSFCSGKCVKQMNIIYPILCSS